MGNSLTRYLPFTRNRSSSTKDLTVELPPPIDYKPRFYYGRHRPPSTVQIPGIETLLARRLETAEEQVCYLSNRNISAYQAHRLTTAITALRNAVSELNQILSDNPAGPVNRGIYIEIFIRNDGIILDVMCRRQYQPIEDEISPPSMDNDNR